MTIKIKKYTAKPVQVEAIQITKNNMAEVAKWCKGEILTEEVPAEKSATGEAFTERYIRPKMFRPKNQRPNTRDDEMTKGYVGKWIIKRGTNFKVYTDQAFANNYTDGQALPLAEQKHRDEVSPSIFNGMVQEMTQPRETHLAVSGHETKFVTPSAGVPMRDPKSQMIARENAGPNVGLFVEAVPTGFEKPGVVFDGVHYDNASDIPVAGAEQ